MVFGLYPHQFSPDLDKIWHFISTANNVDRTWVSLESVEWKPYFIYGPLGFLPVSSSSHLISTKFGTCVLQAIVLIGSNFRLNWCSGHRTISDLLYGVLSLLPPFSPKLGTENLRAVVLSGLSFFRIANSDLCHLKHKLIGFYNRDEKCLLCGTDWVFK
jgi:hypothetical protein